MASSSSSSPPRLEQDSTQQIVVDLDKCRNSNVQEALTELAERKAFTAKEVSKLIISGCDGKENKRACFEAVMSSLNIFLENVAVFCSELRELLLASKESQLLPEHFEEYEQVNNAAKRGDNVRSRKAEARNALIKRWADHDAKQGGEKLVDYPELALLMSTQNGSKTLQRLCASATDSKGRPASWDIIAFRMSYALLDRLERRGRGYPTHPVRQYTANDCEAAINMSMVPEGEAPSALLKRARDAGLQLKQYTCLLSEKGMTTAELTEPATPSSAIIRDSSALRQTTSRRPPAGAEGSTSRSAAIAQAGGAAAARSTSHTSLPVSPRPQTAQPAATPRSPREPQSPTRAPRSPTAQARPRGMLDQLSGLDIGDRRLSTGSSQFTGRGTPTPAARRTDKSCLCFTSGTSSLSVANYINGEPNRKQTSTNVREMLRHAHNFEYGDGKSYCWKHTQDLGRMLGLKTSIQHAELGRRIERIGRADSEESAVQSYRRMQIAPGTYQWFTRTARPPVPADALGPYQYFSNKADSIYSTYSIQEDSKVTELSLKLDALGIVSRSQYSSWKQDGSINLDGFFSWWKSEGLLKLALEEFDMYRFHLREIDGKPNKGWLRNAFHMLCQQAMRMDMRYWLAYVLLRPDNQVWLVSYPYYAKYTVPGDRTVFRHIDLNVARMAEERHGLFQIQGSLSIDDETVKNCTEIVPRMHLEENLKEWAKRWKSRKHPDGPVQAITDETLTKQDLEDFQTQWKTVPCKALSVRITSPAIPHGSTGPADRVRRTMLPWLVGVARSHEELEVREGGVWSELSAAHRDLDAASRTPSGLPNRYGNIQYPFPAAVRMNVADPISQALVAQRKWLDFEVSHHVETALYGTVDQLKQMIAENQRQIAAEWKRCWKLVTQAEIRHFHTSGAGSKSKSYFKQKGLASRGETAYSRRPDADYDKSGGIDDDTLEEEDVDTTVSEVEVRVG